MDVIEDAPVEISDLQLSRIISVIVMNFGQINKIFEKQELVMNTKQGKNESIAEFLSGFRQRIKALETETNYRNRNGVIASPMPEYQMVNALLLNLQDLVHKYVTKRKFEVYQNLAISMDQAEDILHECERFTQNLMGQGSRIQRQMARQSHNRINAMDYHINRMDYQEHKHNTHNISSDKHGLIAMNHRQNTAHPQKWQNAKMREESSENW
eukprot:360453_1